MPRPPLWTGRPWGGGKGSLISSSARACLRRLTFSEIVKITKKAAEKLTPAMVATDLVKRLVTAKKKRTRKTDAMPMGISVFPMVMLGGTFHPRSPLYLKRRTSMARQLKVKLQ